MAVLGTYRVRAYDVLPSQSGNGIIALFNEIGSNKRVYIKNVEILNLRRDSLAANTRVSDFEVRRITAQTAGEVLTPAKLDTEASDIPSQIKVYKGGNPTEATTTLTISTTTTLAFAIGPPGTITRAAGSWLTDGIIPGASVTITGSVSNNKTHRVRSATATVITVETQSTVVTEGAVAATATANIPVALGRFSIGHRFFSTTTNAFFNNFNKGDKTKTFGAVYQSQVNTSANVEPIWCAEGEGISIILNHTLDIDAATDTKEFHTYLIECMFSLDWGGGDKTYFVSDYVTSDGESSSLFSIMNSSGSGRNIKIYNITLSEIGDTSTPYFMVVPFDYMETSASDDAARTLAYTKMDTSYSDIDSYVNIKKDVSLYPKGFSTGNALFPLSFGSSVPSNGLNYYVTKDFLGPVYSTYFTEKTCLSANPTTAVTNNFLSTAQRDSTVFSGNDLYIGEGEGIAIVAASEALTIASGVANPVNKYSMGKYEYYITFSVEDVTSDLVLTNLISGSTIKIFLANTSTELASTASSSTSFTYSYVYTGGLEVDIIIIHLDYQYLKLSDIALSSSGVTIPINQIVDRVYSNP